MKPEYQTLLDDVGYSSDVGVRTLGKLLVLVLERMDSFEKRMDSFETKLDQLIKGEVRSPNF